MKPTRQRPLWRYVWWTLCGAAVMVLVSSDIAIPRLGRSGMYAHEVAAITVIRAIHSAQTQYYSHNTVIYATSLAELSSTTSLHGSDFAAGRKLGYIFNVAGSQGGYYVQAVPEAFDASGGRTFFSDQTMVMHEHCGPEQATARPSEDGVGHES